ncbi:MAG: MBL fold metallo-hydrolase [Nannocystaceae bacterium]
MPIEPDQLPPLDLILISHDHYDHLDLPTISWLATRETPWVTSLGSRADVEMQRRGSPVLRPRLVYYGARAYADQLDRGDGYHFLEPTSVVAWLVEPLFPTRAMVDDAKSEQLEVWVERVLTAKTLDEVFAG